ncbi:MAG: lysophospholipid acyltransferase family protein [candidate division WOR-3 bacterium]
MRKVYKRFKRFLISLLIITLTKIFFYYPLKFHKFLSLFFYFFLSRFRKIGIKNLEIAKFKKKILWKNFCFMTYGLLKFIKMKNKNEDFILKNTEVINFDILKNKIEKKRGVLGLTLHMGFWEIIPAYFSLKKIPVCVLASKVYTDFIDNFINSIRKNYGTEIVHPENTFSLVKKLKKGYAVGILMDQKQGSKRIKVDFFGKKVEAPSGPLEIAYKINPEVILMRCEIEKGKEIIYIEDFTLSYNLKYDLQNIYNKFEKWIRRKPWQWVWIHQRF